VLLLPVARVELLRSVGVEAADVGVAVPGADASSWRLQPATSVSAAAIAAGRTVRSGTMPSAGKGGARRSTA